MALARISNKLFISRQLGFTHPALPKRFCLGINKKYQKKKLFISSITLISQVVAKEHQRL